MVLDCPTYKIEMANGATIELLNCDCVEYMGAQGDKAFDLAVCDPDYNIGSRLKGGTWASRYGAEGSTYGGLPTQEYFDELFRVSRNQIIWGGNYFTHYLPPTRCFLIWDKKDKMPKMADCEMAWTSFDANAKVFCSARNPGGISKGKRVHLCQKPIQLYQWIMQNYAIALGYKKVFDSHAGSFSSAIAAYELGLDYVGCEINKEYYNRAVERFKAHVANNPKLGI